MKVLAVQWVTWFSQLFESFVNKDKIIDRLINYCTTLFLRKPGVAAVVHWRVQEGDEEWNHRLMLQFPPQTVQLLDQGCLWGASTTKTSDFCINGMHCSVISHHTSVVHTINLANETISWQCLLQTRQIAANQSKLIHSSTYATLWHLNGNKIF